MRIARLLEILVWPDDFIRVDGVDDIGRHDNQQLRLVALVVPRSEEGAEHRNIHQSRQAVNGLLGMGSDQSGRCDRTS